MPTLNELFELANKMDAIRDGRGLYVIPDSPATCRVYINGELVYDNTYST